MDFARGYGAGTEMPDRRLKSYISWPLHAEMSAEEKAKLDGLVTRIYVDRPADLSVGLSSARDRTSSESAYVWARCLTKTWEVMAGEVDAFVILGGRVQGHFGKYPAFVEQAELALRHDKPCYLLGAFGGAALDVITAIEGGEPETLTESFQFADPAQRMKAENYKKFGGERDSGLIDYPDLVRSFQAWSVEGLSRENGLTFEENQRLFHTPYLIEMIYLVLKGLRNVSGYRPPVA